MNILPTLAQIDLIRLSSIAIFFAVGGCTPGPNNIMVMTSTLRFGFGRTIPHILGIGFGFTLMSGLVAIGLGSIFQQFPWLHLLVKILGSAYLVWMAWKIYKSSSAFEDSENAQPFTFMEAVLFQWVNAKAWQIAITATAMFIAPTSAFYTFEIVSMLAIILCLSFPSASLWALSGLALKRILQTPRSVYVFNTIMAILLVISMGLSWI